MTRFFGAVLCFLGIHQPVEHRVSNSDYDEACMKCGRCGKQLTFYKPK
ncbi:hypothetical protein ABIC83_003073 [Roseateles asaccharophilus]